MQIEEVRSVFNQELRSLQKKKKYMGHFTNEDEKRAVEVVEMLFENKSLPANLLFEILTGDDSR